jgi:hypothetical protein
LTINGIGYGYVHYAVFGRGYSTLPGGVWAAWLTEWSNNFEFGLAPLIFLLFPTGRPPSDRWRPLVWIIVGLALLSAVVSATKPGPLSNFPDLANPAGQGGAVGAVVNALFNVVVVGYLVWVVAAGSVLVRFRNARGVERQQIKWFAYAVSLVAVGIVAYIMDPLWLPLVGIDPAQPPAWVALLGIYWSLTILALPLSIGVAILRYRLYDIDLIIRRTLIYGALTAALGLLYWGIVFVLQQLLRPLTQGSDLAIVGSTLAIAALFQPLRHRIQEVVDRRFYRQRYDASRTLEAFSSRLRHEVDLDSLGAELLEVVGHTMQPQRLSLWLRPPAKRSGG